MNKWSIGLFSMFLCCQTPCISFNLETKKPHVFAHAVLSDQEQEIYDTLLVLCNLREKATGLSIMVFLEKVNTIRGISVDKILHFIDPKHGSLVDCAITLACNEHVVRLLYKIYKIKPVKHTDHYCVNDCFSDLEWELRLSCS